jgi:hypothetical protein
MGGHQPVGIHAPATGVDLDGSVVDQHLHQFFHVERVPFGAAADQLAQRRPDFVKPFQQFIDQQPAHALVERRQIDAPLNFV